MSSRSSRALRGWAVGSVSMLIAAVSHDLGGGEFPGWLALVVGTVFAGILGMLLTSANRPSPRAALPRMIAIVLVSQASFHYLFSWLGSPTPIAGGAEHIHGAALTATAGSLPTDTAAHSAHLTSPPMLLAHLAAALVTIAMLAALETTLWRLLAERVRVVVTRMLPALVVATPLLARRAPVERAPRPMVILIVLSTASRRGPPSLPFA